jgi:hypothetical protein
MMIIPQDVKTDIARIVRSIPWKVPGDPVALCSFRAATGLFILDALGIPARAELGGMIYRAGPHPKNDLLAYCGDDNNGCIIHGRLMGHIWLTSGDDLVDFSVGDWREHGENSQEPIHWTAAPQRTFLWAERSMFTPEPGRSSPQLGQAWYTGFSGPQPVPSLEEIIDKRLKALEKNRHLLPKTFAVLGLKERLSA